MPSTRSTGWRALSELAQEAVEAHSAMQKPHELASLLRLLRDQSIQTVLEIGGNSGGTAWCWDQAFQPRDLICVELLLLNGQMEEAPIGCATFIGDSRLEATRNRVDVHLNRPVDFLFIDGDHRYEAVKADLHNWLPLIADDGVIAFHDICHRWLPDHDMWRFWRELDDHPDISPRYEIYDPAVVWGGIGVATKSSFDFSTNPLPRYCHPYGKLTPPQDCFPPNCTRCDNPLVAGEDIVCVGCA